MEKLLCKYVIPLDTKTKKNSHTIAGCGARCPKCGKYARQFVRNANRTTEYSFLAHGYLHPKPQKPIDEKVHLVYRIYTKTRRRVDDVNLMESLDDILVSAKILADDNRDIIRSRDGTRVLLDIKNPRAEIYIYAYDEEGDSYGRESDEDLHG